MTQEEIEAAEKEIVLCRREMNFLSDQIERAKLSGNGKYRRELKKRLYDYNVWCNETIKRINKAVSKGVEPCASKERTTEDSSVTETTAITATNDLAGSPQ